MNITYSYYSLFICIAYKGVDEGGVLLGRKQHFYFNLRFLFLSWLRAFQKLCIRLLPDRMSERLWRKPLRLWRKSLRLWRKSLRLRRKSLRFRRKSFRLWRNPLRLWRKSLQLWRRSLRLWRKSDRWWRKSHQMCIIRLQRGGLRFGGACRQEIPAKMTAFTF